MTVTPQLGADDAARVLAAATEVWPPGPDFRTDASRVLRELIPCELVMLNRTSFETGRTDFAVDPADWLERIAEREQILARTAAGHPVIGHYLETGSSEPLRVSDRVSDEVWLESEFVRDYLAPLGLRWTLIQLVPSADGHWNVLSLYSAGSDFSERDLAVLAAFTPTLALGCGGAPAGPRPLSDVIAGWTMLEISASGELGRVSPPDDYGALVPGVRLPAATMRAVLGLRFPSVLEIRLGGRQWLVQNLGAGPDGVVAFARSVDAQREAVRRLTARRLQVLELIAQGHTNARIASQLGIAEGTARKHVEQVLVTLGAANRASAVAIWRAASGPA